MIIDVTTRYQTRFTEVNLVLVNEGTVVLTMLLPISNSKTVSASGLSFIFSFNLVAVQKGSGSFIEPRWYQIKSELMGLKLF